MRERITRQRPPSARPSQAEAEEPSQKPQTVGTLHKRSPTTGMYKKFKVAIEGDTLCYADFKEPWRQKPPAVLHGAHVDRLEVANRATLEFMLVTKRNSPERGRSHSFRVHTRGEFEKWLSALQQWLDSLPQPL